MKDKTMGLLSFFKKSRIPPDIALFLAISKKQTKQVAIIAERHKDVINIIFGEDQLKHISYGDQCRLGYTSFCSKTPLSYAIRLGHMDIIEILLKNGAEITGRAILETIPTYKESSDGKPFWPTDEQRKRAKEVLSLLLSYGADINRKAEEEGYSGSMAERTALHLAAGQGDVDLVQWLLEAGADPTAQDCYGWTPLEFARQVQHNTPPIVSLLSDKSCL